MQRAKRNVLTKIGRLIYSADIFMGKLIYKNKKFYFDAKHHSPEWHEAENSALKYDATTHRWITRSCDKAVKLRRFADESAEQKLKQYFITHHPAPEQIIYPDHLSPRIFQIESAWHALTRSPAYVADEAGLGKTITSILCMNTVPGRTLIICPPYLVHNWASELSKWMKAHAGTWFTIGVIQDLKRDRAIFDMAHVLVLPDSLLINPRIRTLLSQRKFTWLFVDEAHRYKEITSQRTRSLLGDPDDERAYAIVHSAQRIVYLSGTPIPNGRPIELYPLLSQTVPQAIRYRSITEYGKFFCGGKQVVRYEGKKAFVHWDFSQASNLKSLRRELQTSLMIRHTKDQVLTELPPKTRKMVFLDAPERLVPYEEKALAQHTLDELMGDDHALGDIATYRREVGEAKLTAAASYIKELLEDSDEKLVVFAHHISVVEGLVRELEVFGPIMIRGGLSSKEKHRRVALFQSDPSHRVVVGNMDAMGTGVTLTKAVRLIFAEYSYVPGNNTQCEDRIHRITQKQNVYINYLVLRNTLDERMLRAVMSKERSIDEVMGGV